MSSMTLISGNSMKKCPMIKYYGICFRFCNQPPGSSDIVSRPGHLLAVVGAHGFPDTFCR